MHHSLVRVISISAVLCGALSAPAAVPSLPGVGAAMQDMIAKN